jgi:hypothetical protein
MSDQIPQLKPGDRIRMMQTQLNINRGIANVCGAVIEPNPKHSNEFRVYLDSGEFRIVDADSVMRVSDEQYWRWKRNGVDTAAPYYPHRSDCAVYNEPAMPAGLCDCRKE